MIIYHGDKVSLLTKHLFFQTAVINPDLNATAVRVLARLIGHYNGKTGRLPFVGEKTLATVITCSVKTVQRAIQSLVENGWITIEHRFDDSNVYNFVWARAKTPAELFKSADKIVQTTGQNCLDHVDKNVPKTDKIVSDVDKFVQKRRQKCRSNTMKGRDERIGEKNTHGDVCDSESPLHERNTDNSPKEDSNHIGKMKSLTASGSGLVQENGHESLDSNTSLKESIPFDQEEYDADLAAFASLANFGPPDPPVSNSSPKELISASHKDSFFRPFAYEFSELWRVWPPETKLHEEKAYKAFVDAVEKMDARAIVFAAYRYANYCRVKITRPEDKHYISKPENWLQYEKWKETTRQISGAVNDPNRPFIADETPPEQQQPASVPEQQMSAEEMTGMTLEEMTGMTLEEINMQQAEATELAKMNQRW